MFSAVTAISMVATRLLLLDLYYILGGDSDINGCNAALALILYSRRCRRYQWLQRGSCYYTIFSAVSAISMVATRLLLLYYILGGDSDINGCNAALALILYSRRCQRYQWLQRGSCSYTIFSAVTAISMVATRLLLLYYILGGVGDINGCNAALAIILYSRRCQRYQWLQRGSCSYTIFSAVTAISMVATRLLLLYYILGGDSDVNGCNAAL